MYRLGNQAAAWFRPRTFRAAIEIALTVALAFQAARLVWIAAESMAPFAAAAPPARLADSTLASLTRFNPFLPRPPDSGAPGIAAEDNRILTLFGVRAGGRDGGSAIVGAAGTPQAVYSLGDEVVPGTVLQAIGADHVVLARAGRTVVLPLAAAPAGAVASAIPPYLIAPPRASAAATRPPPVAIDPKKFLAESGLRPRTENGRVTGYTLIPRGQADTLKRAGLEAGDVLVALNGNRITPERYSELEQELVSAPQVQLTVQRGAETRTITLETGR